MTPSSYMTSAKLEPVVEAGYDDYPEAAAVGNNNNNNNNESHQFAWNADVAPVQAYRLRPYAPVSPYTYRPTPLYGPLPTNSNKPLFFGGGSSGAAEADDTFFSTMCGVLLCMLLLLFLAFVLSYPAMGYYYPPQGNDAWRARPTAWAYGP